MTLHRWPQVAARVRHTQHFAAETQQPRFTVDAGFEADVFTTKENLASCRPCLRPRWLCGLPQKLLRQPGNVSFREPLCFGHRTAARDGHTRLSIWAKPQDISSCSAIAHKPQSHRPRSDHQPVTDRRTDWPEAEG